MMEAKSLDQYSVSELKTLLAGLGGAFPGGEKKELVAAVETQVQSVSIRELKAKLDERKISIPAGSEKKDLIALLASSNNNKKQTQPESQTGAALTVDLTSWSDQEIALLARDRKVDISNASRTEAMSRLHQAVLKLIPSPLLEGWIGSHQGFRQAASRLESQAKLVSSRAKASDSDVDSLVKELENIENALKGHGGMEEKTLFPFLKKEFPSFEKYDASLESQHDRSHQLAGEITSHCLVYKAKQEPARLDRIAQLVGAYSRDLHAHLTLEEQGVLSLVNAMTQQQSCTLAEILGGGGGGCGSNKAAGGCCGGGGAASRSACAQPTQQTASCGTRSRNACGAGACGTNCC